MNFNRLIPGSLLVFSVFACPVASAQVEVPDDVIAVAKGGNEFAIDLYAHLRSDKPTNLFFSPYSISVALAMTDAGAAGQTEAEIANVLHFPVPEPRVHPAFGTLRNLVVSSGKNSGSQLRDANRLWGQKGFKFLPEFLQVTKADYGADLGLLDFQQTEAARKTINSWVEEQTNDKIQNLIAPDVLDAWTRLVLTNAIYFKARWTTEFSKRDTTDAPFHIADSQQITVPTMHQTLGLPYGATDDMQLLQLPYAKDGSLSMLILLPTKIDGLSGLEKRLTNENLQKWSAELKPRQVKVHLPKFKTTSEFSLRDVLKSMGMSLAFSKKADFSRMTTERPLFISAVIHKAFVDVNEEGTEAAAATVAVNWCIVLRGQHQSGRLSFVPTIRSCSSSGTIERRAFCFWEGS